MAVFFKSNFQTVYKELIILHKKTVSEYHLRSNKQTNKLLLIA